MKTVLSADCANVDDHRTCDALGVYQDKMWPFPAPAWKKEGEREKRGTPSWEELGACVLVWANPSHT